MYVVYSIQCNIPVPGPVVQSSLFSTNASHVISTSANQVSTKEKSRFARKNHQWKTGLRTVEYFTVYGIVAEIGITHKSKSFTRTTQKLNFTFIIQITSQEAIKPPPWQVVHIQRLNIRHYSSLYVSIHIHTCMRAALFPGS